MILDTAPPPQSSRNENISTAPIKYCYVASAQNSAFSATSAVIDCVKILLEKQKASPQMKTQHRNCTKPAGVWPNSAAASSIQARLIQRIFLKAAVRIGLSICNNASVGTTKINPLLYRNSRFARQIDSSSVNSGIIKNRKWLNLLSRTHNR